MGAAARAQALAAATDAMLELARIRPGGSVLDVGAGMGETSILAAQRVGPEGRVVASEPSQVMLDGMAAAVRDAGLANIELVLSGAESLDLPTASFDAAIGRNSLMFIPDLKQGLERIRALLKPGARLAATVWAGPDRNPAAGVPLNVVERLRPLPVPPPTTAVALRLGRPGLLEKAFSGAGFRDLVVRAVAAPRSFPSAAEAMSHMAATNPALQELLGLLDEGEREFAMAEIVTAWQVYEGPGGCQLPGEQLVVAGTN